MGSIINYAHGKSTPPRYERGDIADPNDPVRRACLTLMIDDIRAAIEFITDRPAAFRGDGTGGGLANPFVILQACPADPTLLQRLTFVMWLQDEDGLDAVHDIGPNGELYTFLPRLAHAVTPYRFKIGRVPQPRTAPVGTTHDGERAYGEDDKCGPFPLVHNKRRVQRPGDRERSARPGKSTTLGPLPQAMTEEEHAVRKRPVQAFPPAGAAGHPSQTRKTARTRRVWCAVIHTRQDIYIAMHSAQKAIGKAAPNTTCQHLMCLSLELITKVTHTTILSAYMAHSTMTTQPQRAMQLHHANTVNTHNKWSNQLVCTRRHVKLNAKKTETTARPGARKGALKVAAPRSTATPPATLKHASARGPEWRRCVRYAMAHAVARGSQGHTEKYTCCEIQAGVVERCESRTRPCCTS